MTLNICLFEPEIPHNTGSIARTCALTKTRLHLIKPLGFSIQDKYLKRAGLDYWHLVDITIYESLDDFFKKTEGARYFFATTKGKATYSEVSYREGDFIIFGKETAGLPEEIHKKYPDQMIHIPMLKAIGRSLNLSNAANIILFEALRQLDFPYME